MILTPPLPLWTLRMNRKMAVVGSVLLLHLAALWALQTGLLRRVVEVIVPAQVLSEWTPAPLPAKAEPPLPTARPDPTPQRRVVPAAPQPLPVPQPATAPEAPAVAAPPPAPAPAPAPVAPSGPPVSAAPLAPSAPRVVLPSSDADYLNNPKPAYPALSRRLGEQGRVTVRVLIGTDGSAQKAEIRQSSGFERLDQAALATVLKWRYVPGRRDGVPEAMWFNVPLNFVLE